ncbi:hypothetical protein B0G84_8171 [Paraburkholderia sp. BL8N3]|nr:hypothetical protein [Paraburkholderia sp. BL8N3]TCK33833.1 hypothetical protein B0G84_8171 [Paraburkholderia sp. BL8N3]
MLLRLLNENGFGLEWPRAYVAADIRWADFWASSLPTFCTLLPKACVMSEQEADEYVDKLARASESEEFFASFNFYMTIARRID